MKIALAIMSMELAGGAEHDILHLSAGLKRAGHEPLVITSGGRLCQELADDGVGVVRCPLLTRNPLQLWRNGRRLADICDHYGIEVLNPQGLYPGLSGRFASRRLLRRERFVPNVVTIHNLDKLTWWYYKLGAFIVNCVADHLVVESECELRRLVQRGMNRPATVIHNCFPPSKFSGISATRQEVRREMGWRDDQVVFIMPARMSREKQHEFLFQSLVLSHVRELPALYYLAGDGPLLEAHQLQCKQLGLNDRVVFGGFRRDVPKLLKGADVFLLCSRYESLPLSIREAMVASLPVLSTDVGGVSEAVEHEASGLLVQSGDCTALANAVVRLASDSALRTRLGRRGNDIFREKFDYDDWISGTVTVMSKIRNLFIAEHS